MQQIFAVMNDGSVKEMSKRVTVANISQVVKIDYKRRDMTVNDAGLELSPEYVIEPFRHRFFRLLIIFSLNFNVAEIQAC